MTAKLELTGTQEVSDALAKYGKAAEDALAKAVTATALILDTDIKQRIQRGPKSGVTYYRILGDDGVMRVYAGRPVEGGPNKLVAVFGGSGKANLSESHQASAPGQAPATDTGFLVTSINFKQVDRLTAEVVSRLDYASYLEFGTKKIAKRPAWIPALEKVRPEFNRRIEDALRKVKP